ncbi:glycosyltransferase [Humidesulfovibrio sp.]
MRVLVFYDVPGWAWWHKAQAIARNMPPDIAVNTAAFGAKFDPDAYDYLILFGSYMLDTPVPVPPRKLVLGLSNNGPWYVESVRRPYLEGRVRAVFANSKQGRELLDLPKAFCCQNGVDAEFFHPPQEPPPGFSVGWVGNPASDGIKGLDIIREACTACGIPLLTVEHDASKGDLSGIRSQETLREQIYWRASCYVCASEREGTPNPALEALACGVPVVSTPVGNMPEVITPGENGLLVARSAQDLATAFTRLRAQNLAPWRRAARQSILNGWTWPQKARRYESMLRALAAGEG